MKKLLFVAASLFALGIGIILFEDLRANNQANFHPCPQGLTCTFVPAPDQISMGMFPAIAGALILGFYRVRTRSMVADSRLE